MKDNMEWKKAVTKMPNEEKMYNWRALAMLQYIENMIKNGKLSNEIITVIQNYKHWIISEVDD